MTKIVDLRSFREKAIEQKTFGPWQKRFGESYSIHTRIADLSDKTILSLAQPGENSSTAFYEVIMGALDLGQAPKFYYLANNEQMRVVDTHLLLADHVRFELMRRLGWLKTLPCGDYRLIDMIRKFETVKQQARQVPPELDESHPEYESYRQLAGGDKEVFIRRMLREAIEAFKKQLGE
jgi:hypothetical protein